MSKGKTQKTHQQMAVHDNLFQRRAVGLSEDYCGACPWPITLFRITLVVAPATVICGLIVAGVSRINFRR